MTRKTKSAAALAGKRRGTRLEIPCHSFDLDCGARLFVSPRPGAPVTAVRIHLRGGRSSDPEGRDGLGLLVGALADQGTKSYDEEAISRLLMPAGGAVSGDANGLSGTVAGEGWKLLSEIMASMLTEPRYPAGPVARQKERVIGRLMAEAQDPRVQGAQLLRTLVYGDHWLARPERGTAESVAAITPAQLIRIVIIGSTNGTTTPTLKLTRFIPMYAPIPPTTGPRLCSGFSKLLNTVANMPQPAIIRSPCHRPICFKNSL